MKCIIAGSRTITDYQLIEQAVNESGFDITEVVSGGAKGIDALGTRWASKAGIPYVLLAASWLEHGKAAGPIRNQEMANYVGPDGALILIWDGKSKGSADMLKKARMKGLAVYEKVVGDEQV